jgi:2-phosphoglycerate kinase
MIKKITNPDNNALARTYFIGGPPRVGKTLLAYALANQVNGHVVSTDTIRGAIKKAVIDKSSPLFGVDKLEQSPDQEWSNIYSTNPQLVIDTQNAESEVCWEPIVSYASHFCEDDATHILEGVAVLPKFVHEMRNKPEHIIFTGNTSTGHFHPMIKYAQENPEKDWMTAMGYTEQKIQIMGVVVQKMSEYFRDEAKKYGYKYYELDDADFANTIQTIVKDILNLENQ